MSSAPDVPTGPSRFRVTLVRVLVIQVATLLALWLIQTHFGR